MLHRRSWKDCIEGKKVSQIFIVNALPTYHLLLNFLWIDKRRKQSQAYQKRELKVQLGVGN